MVNLTGKKVYKKCAVVLICLLVICNLAQGVVLCLGADGHIEIESAFHKRCAGPAHSGASDKNQSFYQSDNEDCKHCGPCIDVPISFGFAKIIRMPKQVNSTVSAPAAVVIAASDKLAFSAYNSASDTSSITSYFTPLRTIILLA
jgi:hypothetical protein